MIQNDGMCTLLAVVLVMILLSGGLKEWLAKANKTLLQGPMRPQQAPTSCGCGLTPPQPQVVKPEAPTMVPSNVVAARLATATEEGVPALEAAQKAGSLEFPQQERSVESVNDEVQTLEATKKNAVESYKINLTQSSDRDTIGRSIGHNTGTLQIVKACTSSGAEKSPFQTFVPFANNVEASVYYEYTKQHMYE